MNTYDWLHNLPIADIENSCKVIEVSFNKGTRKDFFRNPALQQFEKARRPVIEEYQAAAYESMVWFEQARDYMHLKPVELAYVLMTRSGRVDRESLRRRDPEFVAAYEARSADYADSPD